MADYIDNSCEQSFTNDSSPILGFMPSPQPIDDSTKQLSDRDDTICLVASKSTKPTPRHDLQLSKERRQLITATSLCILFMFAEIIGGYLAGSLAIMTDAAHLITDCISFIVSLLAICLSKKSPDKQMTFGYKRAEVLGAMFSIFGIWLLTIFLLYFALNRLLYRDFNINADTMIVVSIIGIVINIIMAIILHGDGFCCNSRAHAHSHNHNQKSTHNYHNNNRTKTEYKPLINESIDKRSKAVLSALPPSFISANRASLTDRRSSNCSYRSPNHSRTNSFSRSMSNQVDINRRSSHAVNMNEADNGHHDNTAIDTAASRLVTTNKEFLCGCVMDGISVCPIHNYIHRDSSENTPISSDSEDHQHQTHHHLHHNHSHDFSSKNINIQAAVIHVLGDFIQSIGVFISAVIIKYYPNAKIADPLCTFLFSIIVIMTTCTIMRDSIGIILEAVPSSINMDRLTEDLQCISGVRSLHNLNVWSLTVGCHYMSVHIVTDPFVNPSDVLYIATTIAKKGFNIKHCTIQIEQFSAHTDGIGDLSRSRSSSIRNHSIVTDTDGSIINILS